MQQFAIVLILAAAITAVCWVLSLLTKDYSWVDRSWSLSPIAYAWIFAWPALGQGAEGLRTLFMAIVVTLWGARLTFNFARKGGYSGMEDYRWAFVRKAMKPWQWQIFNLLFTSIYQNILLVLITIPVAVSALYPSVIQLWDILFLALFLVFLLGETVADQQQWAFQQAKKAAGGRLEPGFVTSGLFRYSRHPNFFCEMAQWWVLYLIGTGAALNSGMEGGIFIGMVNWSILGAVLLTALFMGSTVMTESISLKRHPDYARYRKVTSAVIPLPPRKPAAEYSKS